MNGRLILSRTLSGRSSIYSKKEIDGDFYDKSEVNTLIEDFIKTVSSVGTGASVYKIKTGTDIDLRSIKSLSTILTVTENTDTIDLTLDTSTITTDKIDFGNDSTIQSFFDGSNYDIKIDSHAVVVNEQVVMEVDDPSYPLKLVEGQGYQNTSQYWATPSDRRLKTDIKDIKGMEIINKLLPKSFKYIDQVKTHFGFIAQDFETVFSDYVREIPMSGIMRKVIDIEPVLPHLVKAFQEIYADILDIRADIGQIQEELRKINKI